MSNGLSGDFKEKNDFKKLFVYKKFVIGVFGLDESNSKTRF